MAPNLTILLFRMNHIESISAANQSITIIAFLIDSQFGMKVLTTRVWVVVINSVNVVAVVVAIMFTNDTSVLVISVVNDRIDVLTVYCGGLGFPMNENIVSKL